MCVIAIAVTDRLTPENIKRMSESNPHGLGLAWKADRVIAYRKGLSLDLVIRLAEILPMPYVFHARIATQGSQSASLCHPFPISENQPRINSEALLFHREVLFHNGHENSWEAILAASGAKIKGKQRAKMSDTQAIAITLARSKNEKLLQLCSGKFVLFSHRHLKTFGKFDLVDGVQYSNLYWQPVKHNPFLNDAWSYLHSGKYAKSTGIVTEYPAKATVLPNPILNDVTPVTPEPATLEAFPDWEGIGAGM